MSTKIKSVTGRQILDSRGNPTVEVDLTLENGVMGRAAVPSGASTGENEACELRDKKFPEACDKNDRLIYRGKGVLKAVRHVNNELKEVVVNMDAADQKTLDQAMIDADGTPNKGKYGANAILGISMAAAKAVAATLGKPLYQYIADDEDAVMLPVPMMNILNGGKHADGTVDFQEFMVQPWGASTFSEGLRMGVEIFHALKDVLKRHGHSVSVGDEGGYAPSLHDNEGAMDMVMQAILEAGYKPGEDVWIALDPATSEMVDEAKERGKNGYCFFKSDPDRIASSDEMIDIWSRWVDKYPIRSIEDGLDQNDWDGWAELTKRLGKYVQLVGDDLFDQCGLPGKRNREEMRQLDTRQG